MAENSIETARVLVVSRDMTLLHPLWSLGEAKSWHLQTAANGWEAMERVQSDISPHLLVLDVPRGDGDSLHILRWLRRLHPDLPVLVTCHPEDTSNSKEAIRLGAEDVLMRPFDVQDLESKIAKHLSSASGERATRISSDNVESVGEDEFFLSASPVMQKLRAQAELLAQADVPVLILGELGSGKGTVARLIHKLSVHSGFEFLRVNCAEMPGELLEFELFGKANGPAANGDKPYAGAFSVGEKGTVLLEEITEMPLNLQGRLLQVLQDKQFARPGDANRVEVDVRILVSSSAKLDRALAENRLREDLYYRLSAFTVHVPALRQRKEEIKVLLHYSMHKLARHYGLPPREFTEPVLEACVKYPWPGNLKELETFVKRYLIAGDKELVFGGLESEFTGLAGDSAAKPTSLPGQAAAPGREASSKSLKSLVQNVKSEAEKNAITVALEKTGWNRKAAAQLLKVSYRTMLYKIDQYEITPAEPYTPSFPGLRTNGRGNGKAV